MSLLLGCRSLNLHNFFCSIEKNNWFVKYPKVIRIDVYFPNFCAILVLIDIFAPSYSSCQIVACCLTYGCCCVESLDTVSKGQPLLLILNLIKEPCTELWFLMLY